MPGDTEALLVARNQEGNHGTLAFTLGSTGLQLIIMWTSGLNCDHYANTLAVGITNSPNSDKFRCTNVLNTSFMLSAYFLCSQMYFEPQTWFRKVNFQQHPDEVVVVEAAGRRVTATMLVRPKATIDVVVDPI